MTVKIWNQKNNELMVVMEWTKGRLDSRRFKIIVNQLFMLAADSCENDNLIATFDNSPQTIRTETFYSYYGSEIRMRLFAHHDYIRCMTIAD